MNTTPVLPQSSPASQTYIPWVAVILVSALLGSLGGAVTYSALSSRKQSNTNTVLNQNLTNGSNVTINNTDENSPTIDAASKSIGSVVSIVASKEISALQSDSSSFFDKFFSELYGQNGRSITPDSTSDSDSAIERQDISAGTGFVVTNDGYIITNRHVVEDTTADYTVIFNDGTEVVGTVVDRDSVLDIAFVKVDPKAVAIHALPLGISSDLQVGQTAIAIGNSLGEFSNTVSKGIVSGLNRSIQASDSSGSNIETLDNIIQTDASINSGNSGGPLLDVSGNVIGVNVAKAEGGENIGFAIPIDIVKPVLSSIIKSGKIIRPYLGVRYVDVTPALAKARGLGKDHGALVEGTTDTNAIVPGSPAAQAGVQAGDQIFEINSEKITKENNLRSILAKYGVGETVSIKILRNGNESELKITLAELPR